MSERKPHSPMQYELLQWRPGEQASEPTPSETLSTGSGHLRRGCAGHLLVQADLNIRGHDAFEYNGLDTDIISRIDTSLREFQVKSSTDGHSFGCPSGGSAGYGRTLDSYIGKIHAFCFVFLLRRLVYYYHIDALRPGTKTLQLPDSCWSRRACDMSFDEMMRRFRGQEP